MVFRSCLLILALTGAISASAVESFCMGESPLQRFDTRHLAVEGFGSAVVHDGGTLSSNECWSATVSHVVYGTLIVPTNVTLTIERGATVKFVGGGIWAFGECVANGVAFADAVSSDVPSYVLKGNVAADATTTFSGRDYQDGSLHFGASRVFALDTRGLFGEPPFGTIVHWGGSLDADAKWAAGETHVVYGTLHVVAGVTLTIQPGAVVKFVGGGLSVDGLCLARGVTFTDLDDASRGLSRMDDALPYASYVLEGNIETDDTTVTLFRKGHEDGFSDPGVSRVFRLETDVERVRFAGEPREVTFSTVWDGSSAVEVTETRPDGSTVVLTNGVADSAGVFLWDAGEAPGLYTLRHVTDTNEFAASFYRLFNAKVHSGPISETNVWKAGIVHVIDRSVTVEAGGSLLIEPGAVVKFFPGSGLTIEAGGICTARDVIFTSVHDTSAGGDTLGEGGATEPGEDEYLIVGYVRDSVATEYRYGTHSLSGTIAGVETWEANRVYVIDGTLTVAAGAGLTIARGAVVKFTSGSTLVVEDGATCSAEGVIFTHIADDSAGGDTMGDGDETQPEIGAYTITGLILDDETTQYRYGAPVVTSGTISQSTFWRSRNVYRVTGNLTIANGATLTIMPGAIVKFDAGKSLTVSSGGTLNAIGTRAQPIVFTSIKDDEHGGDANGDGSATRADCGDWKEIVVSGAFNANYVNVLYGAGGGASDLVDAIKICSGGTVSMKNSRIEHMQRYAVCDEGGSSHFENCVINDAYMAFRHGSGYLDVFDNCVIHDCSYLSNNGGQVFRNCIVADMTTDWQWGTQYGLVQCLNCVFWNKEGNVGPHSLPNMQSGSAGNIWADPTFVDSENGDFRIAEDSPCIDAGDGTVAPELDWYGQPRVTFPSAQQTGVPDAKGNYVDVGIYEVQPRNVKSDIDLSIVSVATEPSATVGGTLKVSWTVENVGSANATGSWRDAFELIDASGAAIKLGNYTVSGGIVAGGQRAFTTSFRVPAAAAGAARLRVKVNPERDIFEGSATGNNVAIADGTVDIAIAVYSASEHSAFSIGPGSSMALTLSADSGVTALIIRGGPGISAYGAFGYLPKALRNDATAVRLGDGSLLLALPSSTDAGDFTFVIANGGYGEESVTIEPITESLQVTEVTPNRLANTGDGYITIRGVALDKVTQVRLVGNATYSSAAIAAASSGELTASFPLANAVTGTYALEIEDADGAAYRLEAAVEIYKPKMGPKLEAHLEIPSAVRQGRIYTGKIVYSNMGDEDMHAPWLLVKMSGAKIVIDGAELDGSDLEVVGISASHPYGMLKAGETVGLAFTFRCDASLDFSISTEECRPEEASMSKCIADIATRVNMRGRPVYLLGELMRQLELASEYPDRYALSGVLLEEVDGSPLEGIELGVYNLNGECVSADTVDASGRFVIDGLVAGEKYAVKILTEGISGTFSVPDGCGGDVNDLVWYATRGFPVALTFSHLDEPLEKINLYTVSLTERSYGTPTNIMLNVSQNGRAETRVPFAGTYLMVARDGTGLEAASMVNISSFDMATIVEFDFSSGSKVLGRICDQDNMPIVAADVVIKNIANGSSIVASSDESGDYRVGVLPSGEYEINVSADGYCRQAGKIVFVDGKDDYPGFDFSLHAMRNELNGSVKYRDAKGWLVEFTDAAYSISRRTWVDESGCFSFKGLPEGKGVLRLYDNKGLLRWVEQDLSIDEAVKSVTIEGSQLCYMVCRAYSEDGAFVPATWVWTSGTGDWQMSCPDDEGESIVAVPNGEYRVTVNADGYVSGVLYKNAKESKSVSITLRKAGYCRFSLPEDVDVGKLELVTFNSTGLHYGGSSVEGARIVSTSLEPGEAQMFVVQGDRAFYSEPSIIKSGITNDVCTLDGKMLEIDLSEQNWSRVVKVNVIHRDGSGIALSRAVASRILAFSEYPDVALTIEARGVHDELLASAEHPVGSGNIVRLFPCNTLNVTGELHDATQSQLLGATVAFTSIDGRKLRTVSIAHDGGFVATAVPESFANLWFSLSDGTSFSIPRTEAASVGYACAIPVALGSHVIRIEDKSGSAIIGMPFVISDKEGNSTVQTTDSQGNLSIRRRPGEQVVTSCDKALQIDPIVVDVSSFVCPICHNVICTCPFETGLWVCEKCGKNPCVCEPEKIEVKETDKDKEEDIPQYELPKIQVKYGGTLIDDINLHDWDFWNPSECWATDLEMGLDRYIDEYIKIHKSPPPYVQVCEERKCTYNQRVYDRYKRARQRFSDGWDRIRIALDQALERSRQCRRLLCNSAAGELGSAYASYMLGPRLKAPEGACGGEKVYVAVTRSTLSSGPSGYAAYVNARDEGASNPNADINREGGKSILLNLGGEAGEAMVEYSEYAAVKDGGRVIAAGCGPVASTVSMWNKNWGYKNEMNERISFIASMFTYLDAILQYLIGAANTPYHECQRTYSPYETPYALYILPLETYKVPTVTSTDPNEMVGPMGKGDPETERFVKPGEWMTYTVYFENQPNATASAQEVWVTNPLSEWLDWSTFEMGEVAFNNQIDLGLVGLQNGTSEAKMNGTNLNVRTEVSLDTSKGEVSWYLRIVDPDAQLGWPEDPFAGFLPPNDETHCGEGHLTYRVKVREDAPKGARIDNSATIIFDYNDPIETDPAWWNTVGSVMAEGTTGEYVSYDLVEDLGIEIPSDVDYAAGDKVTVKVEGLPKGLKVVTTPVYEDQDAKKKVIVGYTYTIEGVPTEAIDFETRPMFARVTVTYKDKTKGVKGKVESLQPIVLSIMTPEPVVLTAGVLGQAYGPFAITELWSEVGTSKEWSFKGWPAGLKYKDGKLSGTPTKAGEFPITATWKHKLADGKTTVSETFSAVLTVWGDDGASDFRYTSQAYGAAVDETIANAKSVSGLPTGLKFDKATGQVTGTPTKAGVFAVTVTKTDNTKETFLWKIAPATAPTFALDTGTAPVADMKVQIVQGANQAFAIAASEGAKVSVSGLPTGLKLVQDKTTKLYTVEGVATKPGEYRVTFKTILNGVTTTSVVAFTVKGNPFVATYCGYAYARPAAGAAYRLAVAEVTVAAAGTVKLTYTEGKTKYTASVKSFDWDDATGEGTAEGFVLKVSSADKQLGYGDRKATLTFEDCGAFLLVKLDIADANGISLMPEDWDECLYATVKTTKAPLPASQTFVFRTRDGTDTNALATGSVSYDAKKATAAFSGKLYEGTAVKATVPVIRWDDEGTSYDYGFAPFLTIAKDGTAYCFNGFFADGGYVNWVGEDGGDAKWAWSAEYTSGDKKFAELVPETGTFAFGWGSDAEVVGAPTESFTFEVTKDKNDKPAGVAIYDADRQPDEKPLATVTAKVGKTTGAISVSFTSKKDDKAKYAVELVWRDEKLFAGHVTRTWKGLVNNKPANLSASGTAEVK